METTIEKEKVNNRFYIGRRLYQFFGNGMRYDTIIAIGKYHCTLSGEGKVHKKRLVQFWNA